MKKFIAIPLFFLFLMLVICAGLYVTIRNNTIDFKNRQEALAEKLGVNIQEYPYPSSFPAGYFYTILRVGMPLEEVHKIIKGYEAVYSCDPYGERYYYYSKDKNAEVQFNIFYDNYGGYKRFEGEDGNSPSVNNCRPGLARREQYEYLKYPELLPILDPSNKRVLQKEDFDFLKEGISYKEIISRVGKANRDAGSGGVFILVYPIENMQDYLLWFDDLNQLIQYRISFRSIIGSP